MKRRNLLAALLLLTGCSGPDKFGERLAGPESRAWELCKKTLFTNALEDWIAYTDPIVFKSETQIIFEWSTTQVIEIGGPKSCETDAQGTRIIKIMDRTDVWGRG